jgi:acetylornithine deacetylase
MRAGRTPRRSRGESASAEPPKATVTGGEREQVRDEMLARLVAFDTTSRRSNLPLVEYVCDYLARFGVDVRLFHDPKGEKANLFATLGPNADGGIVLSGHTDCVPVDGQDWSSDPFVAVTRDSRVYGRGTCDMKGFIAVVLALVPEMAAARLTTPIHLALSYDEEIGCRGVPGLLARIGRELPSPQLAIVGEPTGMAVVNTHKGIYAFETLVTGLEAHSSAPELGESAISRAAELVCFIDGLARELAEQGPFDDAFVPPCTTVNVGEIEGGTAVNIIPRQCRIAWELRPVPGHDPRAVRGRLERFVQEELLPRMRRRFPRASIVTTAGAAVPPLVAGGASAASALVDRLLGTGRGAASFTTEAGLFQAAGIPSVVIGPGSIEQAHKPDEFVEVAQLEACEQLVRAVIDHAAGGSAGA